MFNRNKGRFADMGKVKRTTEEIIDDANAKHNRIAALWSRNRPSTPAVPASANNPHVAKSASEKKPADKQSSESKGFVPYALNKQSVGGILSAYWFPIACVVIVLLLVVWAMWPSSDTTSEDALPLAPAVVMVDGEVVHANPDETDVNVSEPTVHIINEKQLPEFDIVRIEKNGSIIIAGRYLPQQSISVMINNKIVATERTDANGEFVHAPTKPLNPGNYTIKLTAVDHDVVSENDVFLYIAQGNDYSRSLSLLMTKDGSKVLQAPMLADGDLAVSKIDYLENGRIVVQGRAIPRLRVTLTLDGNKIGTSRTSDHKNFMLGADTGNLTAGTEYTLVVNLHDASGNAVSAVTHKFKMPEMTPGDDTWYTVRRGDSLWIISRNFIGRGVRYTVIFEANKDKVKKADLIYPNQKLRIPVTAN
ncbi:MAG: LysM peptidoglycan-binding domain-containing protein [Alphaproteobacteria bacterium]|nr:LysM peptidoglycan-binding domain-containing protein [Alphaproteobacteria bacterium]